MPLQTNAAAQDSATPASTVNAVTAPRFGPNSTPLKALAGGVLLGVVIGGFVSPLAGKFSGQFSTGGTTPIAAADVSVPVSTRSAIQDARGSTGEQANATAVSPDAGHQPLTLSNAAVETDR